MVTGLSARGLLTVRGAGAVAEGTPVLDEEGRFHGKVVRVFGPVARPYIAVAPRRPLRSEDALALVGQRILTEVPRHGP